MLTHPTQDKLSAMKLNGMAKAFAELAERADAEALSHGEWLAILLERETTAREDSRLKARLRYPRVMRALGGVDLLILDDWGLETLDAQKRHDLLEIIEERYGRGATLVTTQIPIDRWHEVIGDPTYADAILDRLVHNAHRVALAGDSLRRRKRAA